MSANGGNTKWIAIIGAACLALGGVLGGIAVRGCSDPGVVTEIVTRIDTVRGKPDTVFVAYAVPRYIERPAPEPTPDSTAGFWIELLWKENTLLRRTLDSCRGLELTAVTETPLYSLRQQFLGPVYYANPDSARSAMPFELHIKSSDTTRTEIQPCPTDWWRTVKDYALAGSLGVILFEIIRTALARP